MDAPRSLLVLGGSGFLGAQVVRSALAIGFERVVCASRDPNAAPREADTRLVRVAFDLANLGGVEELLRASGARAVVHCAAMARVADCEREPARAMLVNALAAQALAEASARLAIRLVLVSTDLVFGRRSPPRPSGFVETDEPGPLSQYGESKLLGEQLALSHGSDVLVVRLPLLFGDSLGRALGATDSVVAAVERGEAPVLFADEWRTPLDVTDAARALLELAASSERGLLHVAGPKRLDRVQLGLAALEARGFGPLEARSKIRIGTRADHPHATPRPADVSLDASQARARLATRLRNAADALRDR
jgi:dTDP-4-dehydrorhamnose reductase